MSDEKKKKDAAKVKAPAPLLGLGFFGMVPEVLREEGRDDERGGEGAKGGGSKAPVDAGGASGGKSASEGAGGEEPVIGLGTLERLRNVFAPANAPAGGDDKRPPGKRGSAAGKPPRAPEGDGDDGDGDDE